MSHIPSSDKGNKNAINIDNDIETLKSYTNRKLDLVIKLLKDAKESGSLIHFSISDSLSPLLGAAGSDSRGRTPLITITLVMDELIQHKFLEDQKKLA